MTARHERAVRWARRSTLFSLLAFCGIYVLALIKTSFEWAKADACLIQGARYEPEEAETSGSFPFKATCNADYDMVPGWLNPTFASISVVFLISLALLVVTSMRRTRARSTAS